MARHLILELSVKRRLWRGNDDAFESSDAEYAAVRPAILKRDNYTCSYCSFRAMATEVHHLDDDHSNNAPTNLACACPLCHGVNHIGQIGKRNGGVLIYLPEVSQVTLNHLMRTTYVALEHEKYRDSAKQLVMHVLKRKPACEQYLGTSNPLVLAESLLRLHPDEYGKRQRLLGPIRLVFNPKFLQAHTRTLADTAFRSYPFDIWENVARAAEQKIAITS